MIKIASESLVCSCQRAAFRGCPSWAVFEFYTPARNNSILLNDCGSWPSFPWNGTEVIMMNDAEIRSYSKFKTVTRGKF